MREAGDICYADVKNNVGIVEYYNEDDMKYAARKLDDTEFKSHEVLLIPALLYWQLYIAAVTAAAVCRRTLLYYLACQSVSKIHAYPKRRVRALKLRLNS